MLLTEVCRTGMKTSSAIYYVFAAILWQNVSGLPLSDPGAAEFSGQAVGGHPAPRGLWKFVAAVHMPEHGFICAASLVAWDTVVTTAHCVDGAPEPLTVKIGLYNRTAGDELEEITVLDVDVHEDYVAGDSYHNDIAILTLERPVIFREPDVELVRLPFGHADFEWNNSCWIVGWGRTSHQVAEMSDVLSRKSAAVIDHCVCQERWDMSMFRPRVYSSNVCVDDQGGTVSACQGDSGSPLTCMYDGQWVLVGVSSWGSLACHTYPSVFTDIADFVPWIISGTEGVRMVGVGSSEAEKGQMVSPPRQHAQKASPEVVDAKPEVHQRQQIPDKSEIMKGSESVEMTVSTKTGDIKSESKSRGQHEGEFKRTDKKGDGQQDKERAGKQPEVDNKRPDGSTGVIETAQNNANAETIDEISPNDNQN